MIFTYNLTLYIHNIIPTESNIMIKVQDKINFDYDITMCLHIIIPTASDIMTKAQDIMTFACDIIVYVSKGSLL